MHSDKKHTIKSFGIVFLLCVFFIFSDRLTVSAKMEAISEDQLSEVTAQSGISMYVNQSSAVFKADAISFSDTKSTPNWIEFKDVTVDDGQGGGFSFDTPLDSPITYDFITNASGRTFASISFSDHYKPRFYSIGDLVFCNQSLGSIDIDGVTFAPSNFRMSSHADGTQGIDFDYQTKIDVVQFKYTYNTSLTSNSLSATGIHLAGTATGDPEDPTSWTFSEKFKVGDLDKNKPATFDVATDSSGKTFTSLNIPMEGTLRIEDVSFGGKSFGPCAIDGINVHRLNLQMMP